MNLTNLADYIGASLSLTTTILYARNNYHGWILCILANFINLYLYAASGIYAHVALEIIYIFMAIYGLWHWLYGGKNRTELQVSNLPSYEALYLLFLVVFLYLLSKYLLIHHTSSTIAELDALAMSLSIIGQWLSARKYIESWAIWFINDCIMLVVFYYKELPAHLMLNCLYLFIAIYGYKQWQKLLVVKNFNKHKIH